MDDQQWLSERFEEHRTRLRAVAYRMLGSVSEADDAVQEAWLRLSRSDADEIENLGGWLTTVVGRVSLNMLRSRKSRREQALDVHVPEPIVDRADGTDPEHEALVADSVGLALLVVLETLSPAERLAFVLHDIFAVPFDEIAPIVDRSPEAARQLASRARRRVRAENTVPDADLDAQQEVVEAFLAAARDGDFDRLVAVLDPDVVLRADFGAGRSREVRGATAVIGQAMFYSQVGLVMKPALINGAAGLVTTRDGAALLGRSFHGTGRKDRRDGLARRPRPPPRARSDRPRRLTSPRFFWPGSRHSGVKCFFSRLGHSRGSPTLVLLSSSVRGRRSLYRLRPDRCGVRARSVHRKRWVQGPLIALAAVVLGVVGWLGGLGVATPATDRAARRRGSAGRSRHRSELRTGSRYRR